MGSSSRGCAGGRGHICPGRRAAQRTTGVRRAHIIIPVYIPSIHPSATSIGAQLRDRVVIE